MKASDPLKEDIFEAPEAYFETLPDRIQERICKKESTEEAGIIAFPRWAYAAASALILLVAGIYSYQQPAGNFTEQQQVDALLAEVPAEAMLEYLQTDGEVTLLQVNLTEQEQEELLLQGLETYEIPTDDYDYEMYELEEHL